jgi:nucleotide-binding universal stress UspA family protein
MREPWLVYSDAQQLFDLRPLESNATHIDPETNVLVLVHPKELSPATQFAIDQYALRGGHILAFVDPLAEADMSGAEAGNPMAAMGADKSSHLTALLNAWGVKFNTDEVVADPMTIVSHLAEHGVRASGEIRQLRERSVAEALLACSVREGFDLLVMGGYGHSRLYEIVTGGTTRTILQQANVPVLLSH